MATINVNPNNLRVGQRYSIITTTNEIIEGTFSSKDFPGFFEFSNCSINNRNTNKSTFSPNEYIPVDYIKQIYVPTLTKLPGFLNNVVTEYLGGKKYYRRYRIKTNKRKSNKTNKYNKNKKTKRRYVK
jgi:hypothetical protein